MRNLIIIGNWNLLNIAYISMGECNEPLEGDQSLYFGFRAFAPCLRAFLFKN
jgi:hypothetical protein